MNLHEYFSKTSGFGVISTANSKGEVNSAVYAKPHVLDDKTVAFIMRDRLTHKNVLDNPQAHYMFIEYDNGFNGVRLSLTMVEESTDPDRIKALLRRPSKGDDDTKRFLVTFTVHKALMLIGGDEATLEQ